MNKLDQLPSKKILSLFMTCGFPTLSQSEKVFDEILSHQPDIIEFGLPFSDPMADGPIIQESSKIALKSKITTKQSLTLISQLKKKSEKTAFVIMCYLNTVQKYGVQKFIKEIRNIVDGIIIVDLPFGTYQADSKEALKSAIKIMKESGAHAVKLEGGYQAKESIERIIQAGIPVMGHLGLTPQSKYKFGTYEGRAKDKHEADTLLNDALMLEEIGCFSVLLEKIPNTLSKEVSSKLTVPIIGIGAGSHVDGQVLVLQDMLGMNKDFSPRFLRRYLDLDSLVGNAVKKYSTDIKSGDFPNEKEQY